MNKRIKVLSLIIAGVMVVSTAMPIHAEQRKELKVNFDDF